MPSYPITLKKTTSRKRGRYGAARATFYEVERRDGLRLSDKDGVLFEWSDRQALAWRSKKEAEAFVHGAFGAEGAKMCGIRVVRA